MNHEITAGSNIDDKATVMFVSSIIKYLLRNHNLHDMNYSIDLFDCRIYTINRIVFTLDKCEILGVSLLSSINYFIVLNSMLLLDLQQQVI